MLVLCIISCIFGLASLWVGFSMASGLCGTFFSWLAGFFGYYGARNTRNQSCLLSAHLAFVFSNLDFLFCKILFDNIFVKSVLSMLLTFATALTDMLIFLPIDRDRRRFYRAYPLVYQKFEDMVTFRSGNFYSLCSPGNQHNQKYISLIISRFINHYN